MQPIILGNFRRLQETLPPEDFQKAFERARLHGLDGSIKPFAIGGSDIAAIYGESPWTTPLDLYYEKTKRKVAKKDAPNEATRSGHRAEDYVRLMYEEVTGNETRPNFDQARHPDEKYKHCVANVDGFVYDKKINKQGLYEGKTTHYMRFEAVKEWKEGIVPRYYDLQCRFYMEVWDLDFIDICCAWGLRTTDLSVVRIFRDKALGISILDDAELFVKLASHGFEPSISVVKNGDLISKSLTKIYGEPNPELPAISLPLETEAAIKSILEIDAKIAEVKKQISGFEREVRNLDKDRTALFGPIVASLKNATKGMLKTKEGTYEVNYAPTGRFSVDRKLLEDNYPEVFKEVYLPSANRVLSIRKEE